MMAKNLKVLLLFNVPYHTPRGYDYKEEFSDPENMYTENDVWRALLANGYEVRLLGIFNDVRPLFEEIDDFKPDVIFNMVEVFADRTQYEKNIGFLLEMIGLPYTGASADALFICNNKEVAKKILRYHRIRVPKFQTFYHGHKVWSPKHLKLPVIVKPLKEEASRGISQASVVDNEKAFVERIRFIHESMSADAIAEEYIDGRELYVSIIGNKRLTVLPPREMNFGSFPEDEPRIATYKAKWDDDYRERWGIKSVFAAQIPPKIWAHIEDVCKRAYRALNIYSYARFDIRVTPQGEVYIIEPNANPCIARIDEMARSAAKAGISYEQLIKRITLLPFGYERHKTLRGLKPRNNHNQ